MKFAEKLQTLRKQMGMSQENLAEVIGVSRQSVSKWESGLSDPEMDKMIALSELFNVSIDHLVKDTPNSTKTEEITQNHHHYYVNSRFRYEYKSKRTWLGLPLVHINIGHGIYIAKGVIAIGNIAIGGLSMGIISLGGLCLGAFSLGFLSIAGFALGLLLSIGGIALGTVAIGGVALGIFSLGGLSIGMFSIGGSAIASHIAIGGYASGHIAIGDSVTGTHTLVFQNHETSSISGEQVRNLINQEYPHLWRPLVDQIISLFKLIRISE